MAFNSAGHVPSTESSIAADAVIDPRAVIEAGCTIGARCVVHGGAHMGAGTRLEADAVVGANATLEAPQPGGAPVQVRAGVRIGANATVCAGVTLAAKALVRPGAVVTRPVPPHAIVEGNPAIIVGYVDAHEGGAVATQAAGLKAGAAEATPVRGVTVHRFPVIPDLRGSLTVGEFERQIPFLPKRYFMVFGVPSREIRGEHAHLQCHQFLICVRGSCAVVADDGNKRVEVLLDDPSTGLYLPPMTWGIQYKYSADATLLVFASHHYDAADYVRDYAQYLELVQSRGAAR
jgi:acetyltransferase-like isoleucine patch superfamily enzyme